MPFVPPLLRYKNEYFVETGTLHGDTLKTVKDSGMFNKLYSIEFDDEFYTKASNRFSDHKDITIFKGTSKTDLFTIIEDINTPITFWLDAHWTGPQVAKNDPLLICPILEELDQIKRHHIKTHTIIIDDMRLMNGHFPVRIDDILRKLAEINPNYKLRQYDDSECKGDVLVAFIDEQPGYCIHNYLTVCKTSQPPGIGDFIRGTVSLYKYAKEYSYKLYLNSNSHPMFTYLENSMYTVKVSMDNVEELLPNVMSYDKMDNYLKDKFLSNIPFSIITNSLYTGEIPDDCKRFLKDIFRPNDILKKHIYNAYKEMNIDYNKGYKAIHLRLGDRFLYEELTFSPSMIDTIVSDIQAVLLHFPSDQFVLLSDSAIVARELKTRISSLFYMDTTKTHLGSLNNRDALVNTLVDYFILSKSQEIFVNTSSGFSLSISNIYGQKYNIVIRAPTINY